MEITRRPEQPRPKLRGTGFTRDKAHAALREHRPDGWKALSRSHQEIGEEVVRLVGMSKEQFCQVVLLPQGDFARFLRSDAEARARLLGALFDTGRFSAAEERLAELRREAEKSVRRGDEHLLALAQRMAQAARGPAGTGRPLPEHAAGEPGLAGAVLVWAAQARADAREGREAARISARAAERAHDAARRELDGARELERLQHRHAEALRREAALDAASGEREHVRHLLDRGLAAQRVVPALELRQAAERDRDAALAARESRLAALPAELAGAGAEELTARERELREALGALAAARQAERRAQAVAVERAALDREAEDDDAALRETEEWLAAWETARGEQVRRVEDAREAAARAERAAARADTGAARLEAAERRDDLAASLDGAEEASRRARARAADAHEHWLDLRERRLRGIAAELAAGLEPGHACGVCGSTEHPRPARPAEGTVDRAAEDTALAGHRQAEEARERADARLRSLREALAAARSAAGDAPTAELRSAAEDIRRSWARDREAAADLPAAREALDRAERERDNRLEHRREAERRAAARASRRDALAAEQDSLRTEVARAREGAASVAEHAARLERRVELLAAAAEAVRAADAAADRLAEADARLAATARRAGFPDPGAAAGAVLPDARARELRQRLEHWQAEAAFVAAARSEEQVAEAALRPPADPDGALAALEDTTRILRRASATEAAARDRCAELDRLSAEAAADARRQAPLREESDRVARLALLAAGTSAENERRMRLESYVLAARLEQVAAAAAARLHRMSSGRYTLVHSDAREGGRGRSGLGLRVVDAWTGTERDTATLSGGETFFASLALALGLADVVTDESGGTRLDTLFIDEGFGSLDEQALDEVLDVLDSLRERDRAVGIVSHVADLRHRVPAQLEVAKSRKGSVIRQRGVAAARSVPRARTPS